MGRESDFQLWIRPKAVRTGLGCVNLHFGEYFRASPILYSPLPCRVLRWFEN